MTVLEKAIVASVYRVVWNATENLRELAESPRDKAILQPIVWELQIASKLLETT